MRFANQTHPDILNALSAVSAVSLFANSIDTFLSFCRFSLLSSATTMTLQQAPGPDARSSVHKQISAYFVFLSNAPARYKVGLQGLAVQFVMEADLVVAVLARRRRCSARASTAYHCMFTTPLRCTSQEIEPTARESSTLLCGMFLFKSWRRRE